MAQFEFRNSIAKSFEKISIREEEIRKVALWNRDIIKKMHRMKAAKSDIEKKLEKAVRNKESLAERTKDFIETVKEFSTYNMKVGDGRPDQITDNVKLATKQNLLPSQFQEAIGILTKHLYVIEMLSQTKIEHLCKCMNDFLSYQAQFRTKKDEVARTLRFARECVEKEKARKEDFERISAGTYNVPKGFRLFRRSTQTFHQHAHWNQAMSKAQLTEAVKLTDGAFEKCYEIIERAEGEIKADVVELLKRYMMLEIMQHCKALEHLTEAYCALETCMPCVDDYRRKTFTAPMHEEDEGEEENRKSQWSMPGEEHINQRTSTGKPPGIFTSKKSFSVTSERDEDDDEYGPAMEEYIKRVSPSVTPNPSRISPHPTRKSRSMTDYTNGKETVNENLHKMISFSSAESILSESHGHKHLCDRDVPKKSSFKQPRTNRSKTTAVTRQLSTEEKQKIEEYSDILDLDLDSFVSTITKDLSPKRSISSGTDSAKGNLKNMDLLSPPGESNRTSSAISDKRILTDYGINQLLNTIKDKRETLKKSSFKGAPLSDSDF